MGKRYNTRLIKDDYSYYVEQIADLFGVDVVTVQRWIRHEGLSRIPKTRPYLVHSKELRKFLEKKQAKQKKSCASREVFCFRCQAPRIPKMGTASALPLPNTSIRFQAKCSICGGKMNRSIKGTEWVKNHPLAEYLCDAAGEHRGVQSLHRECSFQKEENTCLNIIP